MTFDEAMTRLLSRANLTDRGVTGHQWNARADNEAAAEIIRSEVARLRAAGREVWDAIGTEFDGYEDCEDCAAVDEASEALGLGRSVCVFHRSTRLFHAFRGLAEALGPCRCGHKCSEHHDEDTTRCKVCDCGVFALPAPPPEE